MMSESRNTQTLRGESIVSVAFEVAERAHRGATYGNEPYFWHPVEIAALARSIGHGPQVVAMALLHDVVEDTDLTIDNLVEKQFPESVIAGVEGMTFIDRIDNPDGLTGEARRIAQINKAMSNPISHVGKDLDSARNFATAVSLSWRQSSQRKLIERKDKYTKNIAMLSMELPTIEEVDEYIIKVDGAYALLLTRRDAVLALKHTLDFRRLDKEMLLSRTHESEDEISRLLTQDQV